MTQTTAVVLDKDQAERDDIRISFAVLRTDSYERASIFVNIAKAIKNTFPVIVLSNNNEVECFIRNNWLANLFFLRYPADDKEFQGTIAMLPEVKQDHDRPVLIAGSPERIKLIQGLPLLGLSKEPVLIQGERGVGKKLVARAIHGCSVAKSATLDVIDAKDISEQWIRETRKRIDSVNPDTGSSSVSVIENVESLPFSLQSQLLLLMEDFNGNGMAGKKDRVSAPFITLSGSDLESLARNGSFRKDLYHRLSVLKVTVPPLRDHSSDICAMADYFAAQYSIRHKGGICRLPDEVMGAFVDYHWPGNVSELKHSTQQLMMTDRANWKKELPLQGNGGVKKRAERTANCFIDVDEVRDFLENNLDFSLKKAKTRYANQVEKKIMKAALSQTNGNRKKAAGLLNISYKSMLNKVKAYQLV
ncbi:MAG: sigma 54-interacting transcriptional regulator [Desulfosarcina sp.]|nr:sigma 54-interacting transcriptional regulator [Desulfosarcina sp.]